MAFFLKLIIIFVAYFLTAHMGLEMDAVGGFATLVWPPSGIAVASLLLLGRNYWPAIFLGAFSVNFFHGATLLSAGGIGIGNTLEAIVATHLLTRWQDFHRPLSRLKDVLLFIVIGCAFSAIFSATLGVLSIWLFDKLKAPFAITWETWWIGDALGILIAAPLILTWGTFKVKKIKPLKIIESLVFILVLLMSGYFVFGKTIFLVFWFFPLVMWAALSLGQIGSVSAVFIISVMAIYGTYNHLGPFAHGFMTDNLFLLQKFLGVLASTGLIIAAVIDERRKAMEALEHAIQTRDEFLSLASHELRTPLTSLSLQLQLVKAKSYSPEQLAKSLDLSLKQVGRLSGLIENLLNVSLMRTGRFSYKFEEIDISQIILNMVRRYEGDMEKAQCAYSFDIQENIVGTFDALRFEQVMDNVLSNAIKYAPGKEIKVNLSAHADKAVLVIEDSGKGISIEKHSKIFNRYERGNDSHQITGLGLGLFIVKEIIESHKGSVRLENKNEGGAKFIFEFPISV